MEQEQEKAKIDDLFEDEDIPFDIDNEPETQGREKPKSKRPLRWFAIALITLAALIFLSYENHSQYSIEIDDEEISVQRGLFFPVGTSTFRPTMAYESFPIPSQLPDVSKNALSETERDEELRKLLLTVAQETLDKPGEDALSKAETYFERAQKLEFGRVPLDAKERFYGQFHLRKMYFSVERIRGHLKIAKSEAERARGQGEQRAQQWLNVIEKALADLDSLAEQDAIDTPKKSAVPTQVDTEELVDETEKVVEEEN